MFSSPSLVGIGGGRLLPPISLREYLEILWLCLLANSDSIMTILFDAGQPYICQGEINMSKFSEWVGQKNELAHQVVPSVPQAEPMASKGDVRWYLTQLERKLGQKVQKYLPLISLANSRNMLPLLLDLVNDAGQLRPTFVQGVQDRLQQRIQ